VDELAEAKVALEEDRALLGGDLSGIAPGSGGRSPVVLLPEAQADERGITYRRSGRLYLLPWSRIGAAHAAEVGEPEGVQTVVFDLVLAARPRRRCRLDAEPGAPARDLGQAIAHGVGRARCTASLRAVALEGYATRSYPDVQSFEDDSPVDGVPSA